MPPALANAAFAPDFNKLIDTVVVAEENDFESIQLYVNDTIRSIDYRERLAEAINNSSLKSIVIHFPNVADLKSPLIKATRTLVNALRKDLKLVGLIHYEDSVELPHFKKLVERGLARTDMPFLSVYIPRFKRMPVGVENSKINEFDPEHVMRSFYFARFHGLPFVFDIGRIMYPKQDETINEETKQEVYQFIEWLISQLDPAIDVIHTSGKTEWGNFRDFACALGADGDITIPLMSVLKDFSDRGGIVVFEHEDLGQAIDSKKNLEI